MSVITGFVRLDKIRLCDVEKKTGGTEAMADFASKKRGNV